VSSPSSQVPSGLVVGGVTSHIAHVTTVTHVTKEAAQAMVDVADATHVRPVRVAMRYFTAIVVIGAVAVAGLLLLITNRGVQASVAIVALAVLAVVFGPAGISLARMVPKIIGKVGGAS
jgi:hypothetical protein